LQVTDADFERAATGLPETQEAVQNPVQQPLAKPGNPLMAGGKKAEFSADFQGFLESSTPQMGVTGLEPVTSTL
jgi:hypothetical protein